MPYGTSKLFQEKMLMDICQADKELNVALLRYFNPIGAHESGLIGAGIDDVGQLPAASLLIGVEHVQHAVAVAGAQVADEEAALGVQLLQRRHMASGQVQWQSGNPNGYKG